MSSFPQQNNFIPTKITSNTCGTLSLQDEEWELRAQGSLPSQTYHLLEYKGSLKNSDTWVIFKPSKGSSTPEEWVTTIDEILKSIELGFNSLLDQAFDQIHQMRVDYGGEIESIASQLDKNIWLSGVRILQDEGFSIMCEIANQEYLCSDVELSFNKAGQLTGFDPL